MYDPHTPYACEQTQNSAHKTQSASQGKPDLEIGNKIVQERGESYHMFVYDCELCASVCVSFLRLAVPGVAANLFCTAVV